MWTSAAKKIERWIDRAISEKTYLQGDHLHLDEIDSSFSSAEDWLYWACKSLKIPCGVRDERMLGLYVDLQISLKQKNSLIGINFDSPRELVTEMDEFTPPAIYLIAESQQY